MLRDAGIDGTRRPETLSIAEFVRLANTLPPKSGSDA
jgi:16S rRNA A1518/A1519 N6-dimethyltransferase RsmA/KsgA/DIM1 with predicted DNA glycosylase/AP lyase activity